GRALVISEVSHDRKQIFYHAINLAFLYIVAKNNDIEMKRFAQLALDNCILDSKDMWELATIGEANLYLGKMDVAEEYYRKAALLAGTDVRAKASIYGNAFYGYQSLTASKNKDAEFLKMLE